MASQGRRTTSWIFALSLLLGPVLPAQVEPQLRTATDTLDVYKSDASQPNVVCLFDFSTLSRAVYEPASYATFSGRDEWVSAGVAPGLDCNNIVVGKDYGFLFLLKNGTNQVYLFRWAQSRDFYTGAVTTAPGRTRPPPTTAPAPPTPSWASPTSTAPATPAPSPPPGAATWPPSPTSPTCASP